MASWIFHLRAAEMVLQYAGYSLLTAAGEAALLHRFAETVSAF